MGYQEKLARAGAAAIEIRAALTDLDWGLDSQFDMIGEMRLQLIEQRLGQQIARYRAEAEQRWKERKADDA